MSTLIAQAGLPRSGSTLLSCILSQNPAFTVSADSLLSGFLNEIRKYGMDHIDRSQLSKEKQVEVVINFCRAGVESWKNDLSNTQIYLDKDRTWLNQYGFFRQVLPDTKFIICLRDLRGMLNSMEKASRKCLAREFQGDYYQDFSENFLFTRINEQLNIWWVKEPLVALKEIKDCNVDTDNFFFFKYETLLSEGEVYLRQLYDFLEIEFFNHDLTNIPQIEKHYDNIYWPYGDHKVYPTLIDTKVGDFDLLTPEACDYIRMLHEWYYREYYPEVL